MRNYSAEGRKKYREGMQFETLFDQACFRSGINSVPMPLGARRVGKTLVQIKTPFDRILVRPEGEIIFVDCKSYGTGSAMAKSSLTDHQVSALHRLWEMGCASGYVVWFREIDRVVFFDAVKLMNCSDTGKSLKAEQGLYIGPFETMKPSIIFNAHFQAG